MGRAGHSAALGTGVACFTAAGDGHAAHAKKIRPVYDVELLREATAGGARGPRA